jgi:general stress protein 26
MVWPMPTPWRTRLLEALALRYRRRAIRRTRTDVAAVLDAARATMRRRYCVLATVGDGVIDARALQPFAPEPDFTVWLGTTRASRKVAQLARDPTATLAYQDDARGACVVLVGRAEIVDDPAERRRRFRPLWRAFWPDGPEGADYVLLRFSPASIEVWDARRHVTPAPYGQRSARVSRGADGAWAAA